MATRAEPILIGSWPGGINTQSDPSAVDDTEAVDITNFDIDVDGSLKSRPAIGPTISVSPRYNNRILGIYSLLSGTHYAIFSSTDVNGNNPSTNWYNISLNTVGTITSTFGAMAMVQYANKVWLVAPPGSANPGGSWDGTTFVAIPTMPKGCTACVYKERMFVGTGELNTANPSIIYYSAPSVTLDFTVWNTDDNFLISNGDGQSIRKIYSFSGSIVTFKTRSTYVTAYESDPKKQQTQIVSASIGIDGLDCMTENQSVLYVLSGGDAYAINNWVWEQLNVRVPFAFYDTHVGAWDRHCSVSSVNTRVIFRYYDSHYVFNTNTRTWTKWLSTLTPSQFFKSPIVDTAAGIDTFITGNYLKGSQGAASARMFLMKDAITPINVENFTATVRTKIYTFNVPQSFKHMMWWGIDLLSKSNVSVTVIPVTYGLPVYWKDLPPRTWGEMAPNTWGSPLDIGINVSDSADIKNTRGVRMFVRYIKSLRFRQIQYVLTSDLDGTTATGPLQIYSITAYIVNKQLVPAKIN